MNAVPLFGPAVVVVLLPSTGVIWIDGRLSPCTSCRSMQGCWSNIRLLMLVWCGCVVQPCILMDKFHSQAHRMLYAMLRNLLSWSGYSDWKTCMHWIECSMDNFAGLQSISVDKTMHRKILWLKHQIHLNSVSLLVTTTIHQSNSHQTEECFMEKFAGLEQIMNNLYYARYHEIFWPELQLHVYLVVTTRH